MTGFLSSLSRFWKGWGRRKPSSVLPTELLTRYLNESRKFSSEKQIVRPKAFVPDGRLRETSVFRISSWSAAQIWAAGKAALQPKPPLARADILASEVLRLGLTLYPEESEFENHALIRMWPQEKHEVMQLTIELAQASKLVMLP